MRGVTAWLIGAAAAFALAPAAGQSSVSTSLTNFSYTLVDLDLTDGVTPSLRFQAPASRAPSYAAAGTTPLSGIEYGSSAFAPVAVLVSSPQFTASAIVSGDITSDFAMQGAFNTTSPGNPIITGGASASSGYLGFVLSPMTAVSFFVDAAANVSIGKYPDFPGDPAGGVSAGFSLAPNIATGEIWQYASTYYLVRPGDQLADQVTLQMTQSNPLGTALEGYLNAYLSVGVVPEPQTWLMLLAGIGMLSVQFARRRGLQLRIFRRKKTPHFCGVS